MTPVNKYIEKRRLTDVIRRNMKVRLTYLASSILPIYLNYKYHKDTSKSHLIKKQLIEYRYIKKILKI
jgi:hypothetical protein